MITKSIKHTLNAACRLCCGGAAALAALTACADWDDHYDATAGTGSELTLWQTMKQQPQLSDFCQVLEQTKVFRQHRKTATSYAQLLDGGQSFTVLAPVNGTFNRDSLLQLVQTAVGDSAVEQNFVLNHLSRTNVSVVGQMQEMRLANTKFTSIGQSLVGGVGVATANQRTHNGTLHILNGCLPYNQNIYERLTTLPQFAALGQFLRSYDEDDFDENASLSSGMVDGVPVYVDSVVIERNRFLEGIGLLADEDSSYVAVVPSAEGWQSAYEEALAHFVYDETVSRRDSLQLYWTHRGLMDDAVFSLTTQTSPTDSLVSAHYDRLRPEYHVFYKPYSEGILSRATTVYECSNGKLYQTAQWPFTPEQTYFRVLKAEGEDVPLILDYNYCSYSKRTFSADSVSQSGYLDIVPATGTSNWNVTFKLENTLAGTYDICAVILPKSVYNTTAPDVRPCKFKAQVNYVDLEGNEKSYDCGNTAFQSDPLRVDTVVLASAFTFPACNYGQVNTKVSLRLTCNILARETSRYAREMYLDCIYLRPSKKEE